MYKFWIKMIKKKKKIFSDFINLDMRVCPKTDQP